MKIELRRFCSCPEYGTFGRIHLPEYEFFTVERPWYDNKVNISCIPPGTYPLVLSHFYRGGYDTFEIVEVKGRSLIKMHIANFMTELLGCIGIGLGIGSLEGKWCITDSKAGHEIFMSLMGDTKTHEIEIRYVY